MASGRQYGNALLGVCHQEEEVSVDAHRDPSRHVIVPACSSRLVSTQRSRLTAVGARQQHGCRMSVLSRPTDRVPTDRLLNSHQTDSRRAGSLANSFHASCHYQSSYSSSVLRLLPLRKLRFHFPKPQCRQAGITNRRYIVTTS